jgi:hypothetical protein
VTDINMAVGVIPEQALSDDPLRYVKFIAEALQQLDQYQFPPFSGGDKCTHVSGTVQSFTFQLVGAACLVAPVDARSGPGGELTWRSMARRQLPLDSVGRLLHLTIPSENVLQVTGRMSGTGLMALYVNFAVDNRWAAGRGLQAAAVLAACLSNQATAPVRPPAHAATAGTCAAGRGTSAATAARSASRNIRSPSRSSLM